MKRFLSWILTFSLLCSLLLFAPMACAEEDEDENSFDAALTNAFDRQANEWIETDEMRAALSILLNYDLYRAKDKDASLIGSYLEPSYVGKDGINLIVWFHLAENDLMIYYCPMMNKASYAIRPKYKDIIISATLRDVCSDGYYKNDPEVMLSVMSDLESTITE